MEARKQLLDDGKNALLFISATKDVLADKKMLAELIAMRSSGQFDNIQIRCGLHPGVSDLNAYLEGLIKDIAIEKSELALFLQFVVTNRLSDRINPETIGKELLLYADVNGDNSAAAADGVACSVPATLATMSAMAGKPAFVSDEKRPSYLPADRMFVGQKTLPFFFESVQAQSSQGPISKKTLQLPDETSADTLCQRLLG